MSFGERFAPEEKFLTAGATYVLATTGIGKRLRAEIIASYQTLRLKGDPREEEAALQRILAGNRWRWPWLNEWRDTVREWSDRPYMWALCDEDPVELLAHTISNGVDGARNMHSFLNRGTLYDWSISPSIVGDEPPEMVPYVHEVLDRLNPDDRRFWPPYLPGCRTCLLAGPVIKTVHERDWVRVFPARSK